MEGLTLNWEATVPGVKSVLLELSQFLSHDRFYLAGGTALALLEGHRISVDIDLFCNDLSKPGTLAATIENELEGLSGAAIGGGAVYFELHGIQVSIIGYGYPLLKSPIVLQQDCIPLASHDDIATMKLAAITARGTRKDFVDLWILITRCNSLEYYLEAFSRKFSKRDIGHVLRSLSYFDDAETEPALRMLTDVSWKSVKTDFKRWVRSSLP